VSYKLQFIYRFVFCSFLARVGKKRTKETPHGSGGVLRIKVQTSRAFIRRDILLPRDPQPPAVDRLKNNLLNSNYLKL
jgi:hypothetical protein